MKKILLASSLLFIAACSEESNTKTNNTSSQNTGASSSDQNFVTAQELNANPRDYIFKATDNYRWVSSDATCDEGNVAWISAMNDIDFFEDDSFNFNLDDQTLELDILTETDGRKVFSINRELLHVKLNVIELVTVWDNKDVLALGIASKGCPYGESFVLNTEPMITNLQGEILTAKREIVELEPTQEFYSYYDYSPYGLVEDCKEGFALFINQTGTHYEKRAQVINDTLKLESGKLYIDEKFEFAISLYDVGFEPVKESDGYRVSYHYDACGETAVGSFSLMPISEQEWQQIL